MEEDDDAGSTGAGEDVPFQGMGPFLAMVVEAQCCGGILSYSHCRIR